MSLPTVRNLDVLASNKEVCAYKRAFAPAILVMTYASLRFAGAQKIRTFEGNDDSIYGALLSSRTKRQRGLNWPRAFPRKGILGTCERAQTLLEMGGRISQNLWLGYALPFSAIGP